MAERRTCGRESEEKKEAGPLIVNRRQRDGD
jgi:hypothetical protein